MYSYALVNNILFYFVFILFWSVHITLNPILKVQMSSKDIICIHRRILLPQCLSSTKSFESKQNLYKVSHCFCKQYSRPLFYKINLISLMRFLSLHVLVQVCFFPPYYVLVIHGNDHNSVVLSGQSQLRTRLNVPEILQCFIS